MIDWKSSQVTEPPLLKDLSDDEIRSFVTTPLQLPYSNNSQFVERLIREITKKGQSAANPKVRDGLVKTTLKSRKKMKKCRTKKDFENL